MGSRFSQIDGQTHDFYLYFRVNGSSLDGWTIAREPGSDLFLVTTRSMADCPEEVKVGYDRDWTEDDSFRITCSDRNITGKSYESETQNSNASAESVTQESVSQETDNSQSDIRESESREMGTLHCDEGQVHCPGKGGCIEATRPCEGRCLSRQYTVLWAERNECIEWMNCAYNEWQCGGECISYYDKESYLHNVR